MMSLPSGALEEKPLNASKRLCWVGAMSRAASQCVSATSVSRTQVFLNVVSHDQLMHIATEASSPGPVEMLKSLSETGRPAGGGVPADSTTIARARRAWRKKAVSGAFIAEAGFDFIG